MHRLPRASSTERISWGFNDTRCVFPYMTSRHNCSLALGCCYAILIILVPLFLFRCSFLSFHPSLSPHVILPPECSLLIIQYNDSAETSRVFLSDIGLVYLCSLYSSSLRIPSSMMIRYTLDASTHPNQGMAAMPVLRHETLCWILYAAYTDLCPCILYGYSISINDGRAIYSSWISANTLKRKYTVQFHTLDLLCCGWIHWLLVLVLQMVQDGDDNSQNDNNDKGWK